MKTFILVIFLLAFTAFARPQPRFELLGYTESFGPKLSVQNIRVRNTTSDQLLLVGDSAKVGRPSFEYFLESIVVVYSDGTKNKFQIGKWFHKRTSVEVAFDQSQTIESIEIYAKHDDFRRSSAFHGISIYSVISE